MEKEKKHIDSIFADKLGEHQVNPPPGSWNRLENTLWEQRYHAFRRKVMRIAAAAILFLGLAGGYLYYSFTETKSNTGKAIAEQTTGAEQATEPTASVENEINASKNISSPSETTTTSRPPVENALIGRESTTKSNAEIASADVHSPQKSSVGFGASNSEARAMQPVNANAEIENADYEQAIIPVQTAAGPGLLPVQKINHTLIVSDLGQDVNASRSGLNNLNVFAMQNGTASQLNNSKAEPEAEWRLGGQIAPLLAYRSISKEGAMPANTSWYNEIETPIYTYSGGVNVNYSSGNRFSVRTGIYYLRLGQGIDNVRAYSAMADLSSDYKNSNTEILVSNSVGKIEGKSSSSGALRQIENPPGTTLTVTNEVTSSMDFSSELTNLKVEQTWEYLEVPLLVEYKLIDKTIDMLFVTGVSANFLVGNQVDAIDGSERFDIGKTENLNPVNYSGTLGLGFAYDFASRLSVSLEPNFRYYFNPINNSGIFDHHPYAFGFSTGINYTF